MTGTASSSSATSSTRSSRSPTGSPSSGAARSWASGCPSETDEDDLAELMVGRDVQLVVDRGESQPGESTLTVDGLQVNDDRGQRAVRACQLRDPGGRDPRHRRRRRERPGRARRGARRVAQAIRRTVHARWHATSPGIAAGASTRPASRTSPPTATASVWCCHSRRRQPRPDRLLPAAFRPRHPPQRGRDPSTRPARHQGVRHPHPIRDGVAPARSPAATSRRSSSPGSSAAIFKLLVLDQPTRGLDVGSIEFIHRRAIAKRDAGTAILLVSAELDEVLELSDRIAVMYRGEIVARTSTAATADKNEVGLLMATGGRGSAGHGERPADVTRRDATATPVEPPPAPRVRSRRTWGRSSPLPLVSILLALIVGAFVILVSQLVVPGQEFDLRLPLDGLRRADPGRGRQLQRRSSTRSCSPTPLVLGGLSVGLGVQGRPVQHRRAGTVPAGRAGGGRRRRGVQAQPAVRSRSRSRCWPASLGGAAVGLHPGLPEGGVGRPRGRHDDHAQLRRDRRSSPPWSAGRCASPASRHRSRDDVGNAALPDHHRQQRPRRHPASPSPAVVRRRGSCCTARRSASRSAPWAPTRRPRAMRACGRAS